MLCLSLSLSLCSLLAAAVTAAQSANSAAQPVRLCSRAFAVRTLPARIYSRKQSAFTLSHAACICCFPHDARAFALTPSRSLELPAHLGCLRARLCSHGVYSRAACGFTLAAFAALSCCSHAACAALSCLRCSALPLSHCQDGWPVRAFVFVLIDSRSRCDLHFVCAAAALTLLNFCRRQYVNVTS